MALDQLEQDIEDHFNLLKPIENLETEMSKIKEAAKVHTNQKKSITLRVHEYDLEIMRIKASKLGVPYQTYINMLIHKDAIHL
jgi:predicted DNA binding CopG/RHH family protein